MWVNLENKIALVSLEVGRVATEKLVMKLKLGLSLDQEHPSLALTIVGPLGTESA